MPNKKTLVIGASTNPAQYSHLAVKKLLAAGHEVEAIGREEFTIENISVGTTMSHFEGVDTVTIYLNADRQKAYQEYILSLEPKRIIFNPGAENPDFLKEATKKGIDTLEACTLVMLSAGTY
ncbi:MAG: CoA-binding protein [Chitinophagaceae bacterium]|nr:CoA-binding protein [Chitinophagaceae bacterium]